MQEEIQLPMQRGLPFAKSPLRQRMGRVPDQMQNYVFGRACCLSRLRHEGTADKPVCYSCRQKQTRNLMF